MFLRKRIERSLHRLFELSRSELTPRQFDDLVEMVDRHGEYGVSLETLADLLFERDVKLIFEQRELMRWLCHAFGDDGCPLRASVSLLIWGIERKTLADSRMRKQSGLIRRWLGSGADADRDVARLLRKEIGDCPVCHGPLDFHCLSTIAATLVDADRRLETIFDRWAEGRNWGELVGHPGNGTGADDLICWRLLSCPSGGGAILKYFSPVDMWSDDTLLAVDRLAPCEFRACSAIVESWFDL